MLATLAAAVRPITLPGTWSIGEFLIAVVIIAAVVALVVIALKQFNVQVPGWVIQVGWILVVAFVVIVAIRLVLGMR